MIPDRIFLMLSDVQRCEGIIPKDAFYGVVVAHNGSHAVLPSTLHGSVLRALYGFEEATA